VIVPSKKFQGLMSLWLIASCQWLVASKAARGQNDYAEAEQQNAALKTRGPGMETVELGLHSRMYGALATKIIPHPIHARHDTELRIRGEQQHQHDQNVAGGERLEASVFELVVRQRADQKNESGNESHPVQLCQRYAHYIASHARGRQNQEERTRFNERKEDDPADPDDQRQQHEES